MLEYNESMTYSHCLSGSTLLQVFAFTAVYQYLASNWATLGVGQVPSSMMQSTLYVSHLVLGVLTGSLTSFHHYFILIIIFFMCQDMKTFENCNKLYAVNQYC